MNEETDRKTALTVFMLVKTTRLWLDKPIDERFAWAEAVLEPILKKYAGSVSLRFFDVEFYSARVTDIFMWSVADKKAYEMLVEELRETEFWDKFFDVVEILAGVEDAYADNYDRKTLASA
ncbi:darcynin family protein [Mangrovicella endophytica]|uniref:darcynin family protein n=1 Tax=Mangrovicella endophytica TaxID=2066697 RepID=UPI000C9E32F7|nr:darcynin family protein [Mangrovicella endophytica]